MNNTNGHLLWDNMNYKDPNPKETNTKKNSWVLPDGEYLAEISHVEMRESATSPWSYLQIKFIIVEPQDFENKLVFKNYFIKHPSIEESDSIKGTIASNYRQLANIFNACRIPASNNEEDLIGKRLLINLKLQVGKQKVAGGEERWPDTNNIIYAKPISIPEMNRPLPPMKPNKQSHDDNKQREAVPFDIEQDEIPF